MQNNIVRLDYRIIADFIESGSKVLDLGCGDGELMLYLWTVKNVKIQGIELNEDAIYKCVEKGLSVFHSDIDSGLSGYPDNSFDYVILNQSLQEVKKVDYVINESLRVGRNVIIGFPNFANVMTRFVLFFCGRAPVTRSLPYQWYNTPNLRFLSIKDFRQFCTQKEIKILKECFLGSKEKIKIWPNLFALNAVFLITKYGYNPTF